MLPSSSNELRYYVAENGLSPFEAWFAGLDRTARAKKTAALARLEQGNLSSVKAVGEGVLGVPDRLGTGLSGVFRT